MKKLGVLLSIILCLCIGVSSISTTYAYAPEDLNKIGLYYVIDEEGNLWTWGSNVDGSLGVGTTDESVTKPTMVLKNVKEFSTQMAPIAYAITKDGSYYGWGNNDNGGIDSEIEGDVISPKKILDNVKEMVGNGVLTYNNELYIGDDKVMDNVKDFIGNLILLTNGDVYSVTLSRKVFEDVKELGGLDYVIKNDNTLWWETQPGQFEKVMDDVVDLYTGTSTYICGAIKSDHSLWVWGENTYNGLGNGTMETSLTPTKLLDNIESVKFGKQSFALTTNGELYRWGMNMDSESGASECLMPTKILDNIKVVESCGFNNEFYYAISNSGDLYTWGSNSFGTLGNGNTAFAVDPQLILNNVEEVYVEKYGGIGGVAIKTDGTFWTWGVDFLDQIEGTWNEQAQKELILTPVQMYLGEKPVDPPMTFKDVPKNAWFYDAVNYISAKGIMTGMREGYFGATENLSRAQFATLLHRMAREEKVPYEKKYKDVPQGTFFTDAVMWASSKGIITGYTEGPKKGYFGASDNMTREQMAVMMYRYAKDAGLDTTAKADLSKFPDGKKTSSFAKEAMEWAVGVGLITGNADGTLAPQGNVSRAVCATIIMRFLEA